ncbi:MAG: anhydro-N-acetylmuramic acid kinase [Burkholderiales bacterium]|nr:anhydro-N-acetylmuramic acid kinase [Burkholderiales bacterium]
MSGTSLDGIDAVLIEFQHTPWRPLATHSLAYPAALRAEALALNAAGAAELERAALFANAHAERCAEAVHALLAAARVDATAVSAIGCHGQTVRHRPELGYTVQLANGALLAERTGIRVVCDFRSRDVAAGGQGAPLVPAFHAACFGAAGTHRVVVNLGGIANLTDLPRDGAVRGFDTGPANVLLDLWAEQHLGTRFDRDGAWAAGGRVVAPLLARLLAEPYFTAPPPKSTGRELFNAEWLAQHAPERFAPADVQATLAELTAASVADAIERHCAGAGEVLLCGGGARNTDLVQRLGARLAGRMVADTGAVGLAPEWVEASAFAWLAREALAGRPGNVPEVTGARGPRVLGAIYPA